MKGSGEGVGDGVDVGVGGGRRGGRRHHGAVRDHAHVLVTPRAEARGEQERGDGGGGYEQEAAAGGTHGTLPRLRRPERGA